MATIPCGAFNNHINNHCKTTVQWSFCSGSFCLPETTVVCSMPSISTRLYTLNSTADKFNRSVKFNGVAFQWRFGKSSLVKRKWSVRPGLKGMTGRIQSFDYRADGRRHVDDLNCKSSRNYAGQHELRNILIRANGRSCWFFTLFPSSSDPSVLGSQM